MEQNNVVRNGEREISIVGVLFAMLKKWRVLVVLFLIGAVIGCGVSFVKMRQDDRKIMERKLAKMKEEDVDEDKVRQYADYVDVYEAQLAHDEKSLVLKMDPESVWSGSTEWFITADDKTADEICARINGILRQEGVLQELQSEVGLECSEDDFRGLVGISAWKMSPDQQIIGETTETKERNISASVSAWYTDEEICRALLNALTGLMEETDRELASQFSTVYRSSLLSSRVTFGYSSGVRDTQINAINVRQSYLTRITELKKDLSEDEEVYYRYYFNTLKEQEKGFSKLWPAALAVALAFVGALWFAFVYILDGKVKDEDELSSMFGLRVFGTTEDGKKYGPIDGWLRKMEHKNAPRAVDGAYLGAYLRTLDCKAAICLDPADRLQKKLAGELVKANGSLTVAGDLAADEDAPGIAAACDGIILLTRVGRTGYAELRHITELADGMNRKILGAIVIR